MAKAKRVISNNRIEIAQSRLDVKCNHSQIGFINKREIFLTSGSECGLTDSIFRATRPYFPTLSALVA
ncbi:MAG: hypothetical protein F2573_05085 [Actinobacteria bacterium]|nr:hypothetical protein [Actinomycetota bacterium]MTA22937.1 hypothetical protein [Actinomycetota bacterium]